MLSDPTVIFADHRNIHADRINILDDHMDVPNHKGIIADQTFMLVDYTGL